MGNHDIWEDERAEDERKQKIKDNKICKNCNYKRVEHILVDDVFSKYICPTSMFSALGKAESN